MKPGSILADAVSRRFRVHARETRTLKELLVARGRSGGEDVWALRGVSLEIHPGEAVGLVGRNGSGKSTLLRVLAGIIKPTGGRIEVSGRVGSLLELGAGFHPDFSGRENVFLNGSIQGLRRAEIHRRFDEIVAFAELEHAIDRPVRTYSSGMTMRLGFAIAAFLQADVLLLDEVFAVGDENFQRKCFGVIAEFKNRGGTILFVSHDAQSVERLCERSVLLSYGEKAFDGPTHEAIVALPAAARRRARCRRARRGPARVGLGRGRDRRGPPARPGRRGARAVPRGRAARARRRARRSRVRSLRRSSIWRCATGRAFSSPRMPWIPARSAGRRAGSSRVRLDVPDPPLAFGRLYLRLGLVSADGRTLHQLDDALAFLVYPDDDGRGLVRLGGTWSGDAKQDAMSYKSCPDWPELMELAPDLQFKHISVAEAQLPFDVLSKVSHQSLGEVEICCDLEHHVFNATHTDSEIAAALVGHALVRSARVGELRAGWLFLARSMI